jgi:DNA ligase D-like protein (predicted 3'-phosphoesterase)
MPLGEYKKKRNLTSSKEPSAVVKKISTKQLHFVIHEHHASHLHWDLRLEMNGVLKSWAVPKSPPTEKGIKRLAMQVEDHPLAYAKFHGTIPEGNYGAGKVLIWDKGKYNLIEKNPTKIIFELHGKKLTGKYTLIKTSYGGKKNGWLFFKI